MKLFQRKLESKLQEIKGPTHNCVYTYYRSRPKIKVSLCITHLDEKCLMKDNQFLLFFPNTAASLAEESHL